MSYTEIKCGTHGWQRTGPLNVCSTAGATCSIEDWREVTDQSADTSAAKAHACLDDCAHLCGCDICLGRCADESAPDKAERTGVPWPEVKAKKAAIDAAAKRAELLNEALAVVSGPRAANYGPPEDNFRRIANLWTEYIHERKLGDNGVEPHDVAAMMILMKVARIIEDPKHKDSWTDTAGYAACGYSVSP